jgi:hypothetical protein
MGWKDISEIPLPKTHPVLYVERYTRPMAVPFNVSNCISTAGSQLILSFDDELKR